MQEFEEDYYAILGVEETATPEEIRKAYIKLAKKLHPDRYPNDPEQRAVAQREFSRVSRAHDAISDTERRAEYDAVRMLQRKRGQGASSEKVKAVDGTGEVAAAGAAVETKLQQAQTTREDESINIKWANKHMERAE